MVALAVAGSGAAMALWPDGKLAYVAGYTCLSSSCGAPDRGGNFSLFGICVGSGAVLVNVTIPFPFWENLDDHHFSLHVLPTGDLVVAGVLPGPGLPGAVAVVAPSGEVRRYHKISGLPFGCYPTTLDKTYNKLYLSISHIYAAGSVLAMDLYSGKSSFSKPPMNILAIGSNSKVRSAKAEGRAENCLSAIIR